MSFTPLQPPEATARSIEDLLRDARNGKIRIPQFQRSFRWEQQHILDLFDSIYRGYPIGSFLFWDTDKTQGSATRFGPISFNPAPGGAYLIIDGQQRFTTLVATLLRDKEPQAPGDEDFLVFFDLINERFIIPKPQESRLPCWLPLNEVVDTLRYLNWLETMPRDANRDKFVHAANRVVRALRDYKVPVYIVRSENEEELRRIFQRMNSSGKALKRDEIFNAIAGKRDHLDTLQANLARLGFGELDKDLLLEVIRAIVGAERGDKWESIRARAPEDLSQHMADTAMALGRVIRFVQNDTNIPRVELLPYRSPLIVLAKFFQLIPEPSLESRATLCRWLWRGNCDGRHNMNDSQLHTTLKFLSRNERQSAEALIRQFDDFKLPMFKFARHDFRSASTKLLCNVLVAIHPRHLETDEIISVQELIDSSGPNAFEQIVPRRRVDDATFEKSDVFRGTANRILHPHLLNRSSILEALRTLNPRQHKFFESHAIDQLAVKAMREQCFADFLRYREATLRRTANAYFSERCSIGEPVRMGAVDLNIASHRSRPS
jgi:hypothetical protein